MESNLEVLFTPADFSALKQRDLSRSVCVVFDVLRATTSMVHALANGARGILPVTEISVAVALRDAQPGALLAGERDGLRIRAAQAGGVDFDFGNSPREFISGRVNGKIIIMTTTNGTRALQACAGAKRILAGAFLNMTALAREIQKQKVADLIVICAGTFEEAAYEDALAAGLLCDLIWEQFASGHIADSAQMARQLYQSVQNNLPDALQHSWNARRLLAMPDLRDDVAFCLQRDLCHFTPALKNGMVGLQ